MKKILTLLSMAVLATFAMPALAQEKQLFTPADASYNNRSLYAQRPNQLKWVGNTDILMKVKDKEIVTMNPASKKETSFLSVEELNILDTKLCEKYGISSSSIYRPNPLLYKE